MFTPSRRARARNWQTGISLIELVMFIVIVSVALVGVLAVLNTTTRASADPMLRKQSLAIAESILEEIELMPFTFCDPDDPAAPTAGSAAACTNDQNKGGGALTSPTPSSETRYSSSTPFDNVADYGGFSMNGISDITQTPITGLGNYKLEQVSMTRVALGTIPADGTALLIRVTVTDPTGQSLSVEGIRTRYAPNDLP